MSRDVRRHTLSLFLFIPAIWVLDLKTVRLMATIFLVLVGIYYWGAKKGFIKEEQ